MTHSPSFPENIFKVVAISFIVIVVIFCVEEAKLYAPQKVLWGSKPQLSVATFAVTAMLAICLLPFLTISDWSEAGAITTYCSIAMLCFCRHICRTSTASKFNILNVFFACCIIVHISSDAN